MREIARGDATWLTDLTKHLGKIDQSLPSPSSKVGVCRIFFGSLPKPNIRQFGEYSAEAE